MNAPPAIRANFRGTIGKFALDAGFTAPAKGVTALFGASGCGKTTVLRCLAGLLRINGVCEIDGEVWQDENGAFLPTHKRPLGYVFQEASLFQHLSVRRNLLFGAPRDKSDGTKGGDRLRRTGRAPWHHAAARPLPAQSVRRRASARGDRARAPVAAEASLDGRTALGARPRDQERDPAVPRAAARSPQSAGRLHHARHGGSRAPRRPDGADGEGARDRRGPARRVAERSVACRLRLRATPL